MKEITIGARIFPDRIELQIVTSPFITTAILASAGSPGVRLDADNFTTFRPVLETKGKTLCRLAAGVKDPRDLDPSSIDVIRGKDDEILFFLTYPGDQGDTLRIDATALEQIEPDYAATLQVLDAKRKLLMQKPLSAADPRAAVPLAAPPAQSTSN